MGQTFEMPDSMLFDPSIFDRDDLVIETAPSSDPQQPSPNNEAPETEETTVGQNRDLPSIPISAVEPVTTLPTHMHYFPLIIVIEAQSGPSGIHLFRQQKLKPKSNLKVNRFVRSKCELC